MLLHRRFPFLLLFLVFSLLSIPATYQPAQAMSPATKPGQTITAASDSIELIGSYVGALKGLAANANRLYTEHSGGLAVFDVSDPNQPVRRGHVLLPLAPEIADYADGFVYVVTRAHLYTIDVTDPDQPRFAPAST